MYQVPVTCWQSWQQRPTWHAPVGSVWGIGHPLLLSTLKKGHVSLSNTLSLSCPVSLWSSLHVSHSFSIMVSRSLAPGASLGIHRLCSCYSGAAPRVPCQLQGSAVRSWPGTVRVSQLHEKCGRRPEKGPAEGVNNFHTVLRHASVVHSPVAAVQCGREPGS